MIKICLAACLVFLTPALGAQSADADIISDDGLTFHLPHAREAAGGMEHWTVGHTDVPLCAPGAPGRECKVANPTYEIKLPDGVKGDLQEVWLNPVRVRSPLRGILGAEVVSPRSIGVTFNDVDKDQQIVVRVYFVVAQ